MMTTLPVLASYVQEEWITGADRVALLNPATEETLAYVAGSSFDGAAAVAFARRTGGHALRELHFAERGRLLKAWSKVLHTHRDELIGLAVANGGNTRSDAKFDIDGAIGTLAYYATLGETLGEHRALVDGEQEQLTRSVRFVGAHLLQSRRGVAVHINAFNFPAWNLCEKAATAILAGLPVLTKPATSTALVAHRIVELAITAEIFPTGALQLLLGKVDGVLASLGGQDTIAFTGSSHTGAILRRLDCVIERSTRLNVEADSLNSAILATDVPADSETFALMIADVVRDMTQKTGQKCTAIRRVFVPNERVAETVEVITDRLAQITVGNPALDDVNMGPVSSAAQRDEVKRGILRFASDAKQVYSDIAGGLRGVQNGVGFFVAPTLFVATAESHACHEHEVFGPVATVIGYGASDELVTLVERGAGSLVSSIYSDDRAQHAELVASLGPLHGRLLLGSEKIVGHSVGPGTVLPQLVHGGPGRAGGGEELGGRRGLNLYLQRTAIEGDRPIVESITKR